ncbi:MAG: leucine-rich repeat domain-containing protein [Longimicrobiales bacterium]
MEDLAPLQQLGGIEHLAIRWNTKLKDLSPLARLSNLETLILEDVPKVEDLAPLAHLQKLLALDFSGGIWNKNRARSLLPFAGLPRLQELRLYNLRVDSDGLRPLAGCKTLQSLSVSNQFPTEDYAFRAAALPSTHCGMFAPFVHIATPIDGKDVMVVGKGKPFLNSTTDHVRLTEYVRQFEALREEARRSLAQSSLP